MAPAFIALLGFATAGCDGQGAPQGNATGYKAARAMAPDNVMTNPEDGNMMTEAISAARTSARANPREREVGSTMGPGAPDTSGREAQEKKGRD